MNKSASAKDSSRSSKKGRGKYCAVFGCNNSAYDVHVVRTKYHFFEFPKDTKGRNRWCNRIKRRHGKDDFFVTSSTVVCSEHFRDEDILKKLSGRWDLKKGLWFYQFLYCSLSFEASTNVRFRKLTFRALALHQNE